MICRVALPYMHVNRALFEMFRILNEGGELWLGVALRHDRQRTVGHLRQLSQRRRSTGCGLGQWLVVASFRQAMVLAAPSQTYESWQSAARTRRILLSTGFGDVSVKRGDHFVITALKMKGSPKSNTLRFDSYWCTRHDSNMRPPDS